MRQDLYKYTAYEFELIIGALKRINDNHRKFLIIIDENDSLLGCLTDGDIRRYIASGGDLAREVGEVYTKNCLRISKDNFEDCVIDIFKQEVIDFLPIVDEHNRLINIITKRSMHAVLLENHRLKYDLDYLDVEADIVENEIFQRPWGYYKTTALNKYFQSKIICVYPNMRLSLQAHKRREEHWIIADGDCIVQIDESIIRGHAGNSFFVPRGSKHRITNNSDTRNLVITEVQIGDYFGEDDIIRYEDDFGRM